MTTVDIDVLDEAQYITTYNSGGALTELVAWYGGVTYNVYQFDERHGELAEIDVFSASDDKGRPLSQEKAEEKANDLLAFI